MIHTTIKRYHQLMKPGIIRGNLLATWAGFLLASKWHIDWKILLGITEGTMLMIGSACVFNNYIDRGIDSKMERTKKRAIVQGVISGRAALIYGTVLGFSSIYVLLLMVNWRAAVLGVIGWIDYVIFYSIAKRRSPLSTIVGSIAGAVPPAAGYVAVTNRFDMAAILLFVILVFWQMPHFYAIAMARAKEYAAADLPVLPVRSGMELTQKHILAYIVAFYGSTVALFAFGYVGWWFIAAMTLCSAWWFRAGLQRLRSSSELAWARLMFRHSLVVLAVLCLLVSLDVKR